MDTQKESLGNLNPNALDQNSNPLGNKTWFIGNPNPNNRDFKTIENWNSREHKSYGYHTFKKSQQNPRNLIPNAAGAQKWSLWDSDLNLIESNPKPLGNQTWSIGLQNKSYRLQNPWEPKSHRIQTLGNPNPENVRAKPYKVQTKSRRLPKRNLMELKPQL